MSIDDISWGTPPPERTRNFRTGFLTAEMLAVAAKMKPGVWACYEYESDNRASTYATRLRQLGFEAASRGTKIYWRWAL